MSNVVQCVLVKQVFLFFLLCSGWNLSLDILSPISVILLMGLINLFACAIAASSSVKTDFGKGIRAVYSPEKRYSIFTLTILTIAIVMQIVYYLVGRKQSATSSFIFRDEQFYAYFEGITGYLKLLRPLRKDRGFLDFGMSILSIFAVGTQFEHNVSHRFIMILIYVACFLTCPLVYFMCHQLIAPALSYCIIGAHMSLFWLLRNISLSDATGLWSLVHASALPILTIIAHEIERGYMYGFFLGMFSMLLFAPLELRTQKLEDRRFKILSFTWMAVGLIGLGLTVSNGFRNSVFFSPELYYE